jgi:hypothetical protein
MSILHQWRLHKVGGEHADYLKTATLGIASA